jgi:hypothetical protein
MNTYKAVVAGVVVRHVIVKAKNQEDAFAEATREFTSLVGPESVDSINLEEIEL